MSRSFDASAYLVKSPDDRDRVRLDAREAADAGCRAYCDVLAADAAGIVRNVLPAAMYVDFRVDRDYDGPTVDIQRITDVGGRVLYDGLAFDEFDDESELRDKLTAILEYAEWYFGDDPDGPTVTLGFGAVGITSKP